MRRIGGCQGNGKVEKADTFYLVGMLGAAFRSLDFVINAVLADWVSWHVWEGLRSILSDVPLAQCSAAASAWLCLGMLTHIPTRITIIPQDTVYTSSHICC